MRLEPELEQLLIDLVEAERRVPREDRSSFIVAHSMGARGVQLIHPGWQPKSRRVPEVDLESLASVGLLNASFGSSGDPLCSVSPAGTEYFLELMAARGEPIQRMQIGMRSYFDSAQFRSRHPRAFEKWMHAESLLWGEESQRNLTTIGHVCREALQEFASSLVSQSKARDINPGPTKTVARIQAVLNMKSATLGESASKFFEALLAFWGTVSDLAQRQEHGGQKEGEPLTFADASRLVRLTLVVIYEVDNAVG